MSFKKKIGVILAGGQSRRFGEPKAFYEYEGKPMFEWAVETLYPLVDKVMIISHPSLVQQFKEKGFNDVYEDSEKYKEMGPLAGIYTAMVTSRAEWYYVLPCDTPLIKTGVFELLETELNEQPLSGIVPKIDGRVQPLVAIYHQKLLPTIEHLLSKNSLRMTDLIDQSSIRQIELNGKYMDQTFVNINTKAELFQLGGTTEK